MLWIIGLKYLHSLAPGVYSCILVVRDTNEEYYILYTNDAILLGIVILF